jgi:hypothetical protein
VSGRREAEPREAARGREGKSELAVLVACHTFLVAIPARSVVRLFLPDEVTPHIREGDALLGTVRAGDRTCVAWDLGRLLELEATKAAWVVVDVASEGRVLPVALRTGVCALVAEVRADLSLPGRIFKKRGLAFPAAFAANTLGVEVPALFGLWLDPARLLGSAEIAASRAALDDASSEGAVRR